MSNRFINGWITHLAIFGEKLMVRFNVVKVAFPFVVKTLLDICTSYSNYTKAQEESPQI